VSLLSSEIQTRFCSGESKPRKLNRPQDRDREGGGDEGIVAGELFGSSSNELLCINLLETH
jgi:hypothetical protein